HPGRGAPQALAAALRVGPPLGDQGGDEVVGRLPAARPDRGADVGQIDAAPALDLPSHPVEPAEAGEAGPAELLREEALQPAPDARLALGEADDRARDV